ncbi:MAG: Rab family GTPase [Candidatus Heimdallarchaeota archaeon]
MAPGRRLTLKLILIGDGGVGKTSLIHQYVHASFKHDYKITIGLDVTAKTVQLEDGTTAQLSIHDIGGQDRFASVRNLFYKGSHLAMCVYDITREKTLQNLDEVWIPELLQYGPMPGSSRQQALKIIFIGNKSDLKHLQSIRKKEGEAFADKYNAIGHIWTSAKNDENVDEAFVSLVKSFLEAST